MDVVVTLPLRIGLQEWIDEGDAAGKPWSGEEWHYYLWGNKPQMQLWDRVYVLFNGSIRGYAPLIRIDEFDHNHYGLVRHGDAVDCTIPEYIRSFQGWRYRWWDRSIEVPFPEWKDPNAGLVRPESVTKAVKVVKPKIQQPEPVSVRNYWMK